MDRNTWSVQSSAHDSDSVRAYATMSLCVRMPGVCVRVCYDEFVCA